MRLRYGVIKTSSNRKVTKEVFYKKNCLATVIFMLLDKPALIESLFNFSFVSVDMWSAHTTQGQWVTSI